MLIKTLLKKQQLKLTVLTDQGQLQHELLLTRKRQVAQSARTFIGSTPGLIVSFSLGCLFQMRHNSTVKLLRSTFGLRWITKLIV
ncbi:hypothetical protein L2744_12580 [Shewanella profunda]|uniref:hypothetical protein n=1 Tax=Shewanella profunda TaxID=254793 RepID=UPI002010C619|nr:hypothetical protein [Shewanella profunda]MCL1090412.1 hypothetical protein [Shewanella profunda]